jgi:hypothetical protein
MKELRTEVEIQAPADRVWAILTDFAGFAQWNPFMPQASGTIKPGERLAITIQPVGGRGMTIRPTVLTADPGRELRWLGRLILPGLFDGEHSFTIEPLGSDRVRFVQREVFTGLLVPLLMRFIERGTRSGFEAMNQALKVKAEQNGT